MWSKWKNLFLIEAFFVLCAAVTKALCPTLGPDAQVAVWLTPVVIAVLVIAVVVVMAYVEVSRLSQEVWAIIAAAMAAVVATVIALNIPSTTTMFVGMAVTMLMAVANLFIQMWPPASIVAEMAAIVLFTLFL